MSDHVGPTRASIEADFWAFIQANPHVEREYVRLARAWMERRPGQKLGIGMLTEYLRFEVGIKTAGDIFRINNNTRSYMARYLMTKYPDLDGLFETRALRAAEPFEGRLFSEAAA